MNSPVDERPTPLEAYRAHSADYIHDLQVMQMASKIELDRSWTVADLERAEHVFALRREQEAEAARALFSSRSLFDSRAIPTVPPPSIDKSFVTSRVSSPSLEVQLSSNIYLHMLRFLRIVQHYFVFLQLGVVTALIWANADWDQYTSLWQPGGDPHAFTFHFFVNDIFMALFFGIAMVHVTTAVLPGGSLYPLRRAAAPLLGTLGGVAGPAGIYLVLVAVEGNFATQSKGWAVCIATDISVAWLLATMVFRSGSHPAVQFLLLLAVVDDVIGLIVIAVCFPTGDMDLIWLLLLLGSVAVSCTLRWGLKAERWIYYIALAGPIAWYSLYRAGVHPALALCVVVPLIPKEQLHKLDHDCSLLVHVGLFFFALCNAGVRFNDIGLVTLNVAVALVAGKTLGIFCFTFVGTRLLGLKLPDGMNTIHLGLLAHASGVGLTVALFVADLAFDDPTLVDEAKLGALMSVIVAPSALLLSRVVNKEVSQKPLSPIHAVAAALG